MAMRHISKKLPEMKFAYSNPQNFVICWNNCTFGSADSHLFNSGMFNNKEEELAWLEREILFQRSLLEKTQMYWRLLRVAKEGKDNYK